MFREAVNELLVPRRSICLYLHLIIQNFSDGVASPPIIFSQGISIPSSLLPSNQQQ